MRKFSPSRGWYEDPPLPKPVVKPVPPSPVPTTPPDTKNAPVKGAQKL